MGRALLRQAKIFPEGSWICRSRNRVPLASDVEVLASVIESQKSALDRTQGSAEVLLGGTVPLLLAAHPTLAGIF